MGCRAQKRQGEKGRDVEMVCFQPLPRWERPVLYTCRFRLGLPSVTQSGNFGKGLGVHSEPRHPLSVHDADDCEVVHGVFVSQRPALCLLFTCG